MEEVNVSLVSQSDRSYKILLGVSLISRLDEMIQDLPKAGTYLVITDSHVAEYHLSTVVQALERTGSSVLHFTINAGESSKSRENKAQIEDFLIDHKAARNSCIVALGGGVVGDLAGFVAATYLRGIPFIQIPTTLLSMVDSSIGGKVAIDTPKAKNMIGAFWQPKRVIIDIETLKTLPESKKLNGIGEVIKHGIILDEDYFHFIENNIQPIKSLDPAVLLPLIRRSCEIKADVVMKDEKEMGLRKLLNFGHTVGHAVESLHHYQIMHDQCVGFGMVAESLIAFKRGMIDKNQYNRIRNLIIHFGFDLNIADSLDVQEIIQKTYSDKKVNLGKVEYVLPEKIGCSVFGVPVEDGEVLDCLNSLKNEEN